MSETCTRKRQFFSPLGISIAMISITLVLGMLWQPLYGTPCKKCPAFTKRWKGQPEAKVVREYGRPLEDNESYGWTDNTWCKCWRYEKGNTEFWIGAFDGRVHEAWRNDHVHEWGILTAPW